VPDLVSGSDDFVPTGYEGLIHLSYGAKWPFEDPDCARVAEVSVCREPSLHTPTPTRHSGTPQQAVSCFLGGHGGVQSMECP
jgi:hypothetical protein